MDYEKLHDLSCSFKTWCNFLLENAVITSNFAYFNKFSKEDYILSLYKNEFHFLKQHMQELILKYNELEKFLNENNIEG